MPSIYAGRQVCLTTHHGKQRALARPLAAGLGLGLVHCDCDTDQLGNFSGTIARQDSARDTCRRKALLGLDLTGLRLGLASEGSFGPHPALPFLAAGHELLLFIDRDRRLEVVEHQLQLGTNYSQRRLNDDDDPGPWLRQVGFPSHGVIVRPAQGEPILGISSPGELRAALESCRSSQPRGVVQLETDMRAHRNPTRMAAIRRLGFALVRRLRRPCPACDAPGWGLLDTEAGLPCRDCGTPTAQTAAEIWGCQHCDARARHPRADGRVNADPAHCPWCNP